MQVYVQQEVEQAVAQIPGLSLPHNLRLRRNPADANRFTCRWNVLSPGYTYCGSPPPGFAAGTRVDRRLPDVENVLVHLEPPDQL